MDTLDTLGLVKVVTLDILVLVFQVIVVTLDIAERAVIPVTQG